MEKIMKEFRDENKYDKKYHRQTQKYIDYF